MYKTYAPKYFGSEELKQILDDLNATPAEIAKFLHVTERSVYRWMADGSAPYAVMAALWHETPEGRRFTACDVGNELRLIHLLCNSATAKMEKAEQRLNKLLEIADFGAANDPFNDGSCVARSNAFRLNLCELRPVESTLAEDAHVSHVAVVALAAL